MYVMRLQGVSQLPSESTVAAVCDRRYFVDSRKNRRSQSAATVGDSAVLQHPQVIGGVARSAGVVPRDEIHTQAWQSRNVSALEPPRLRLMRLRDIFLMAQPPLLTQEGSRPRAA